MANKYISQSAGALTEVEGIISSAGAGDSGKIPALNAQGKVDMLPASATEDTISITVEEAAGLSAGDLVNIFDNTGAKCRLADGSNGRVAHGFVKSAFADAASALVYKEGTNDQLTGMTPGAVQYLSDATPGAVTSTAPTTATNIVQRIGVAYSATEMDWEPALPITLA